jgi:hypothetical protein
MKRLLLIALCAALLAGCGGGSAMPGTTRASGPQSVKQQVTFRIDKPAGATSAHRRSAQYLSPATAALEVTVYLSGSQSPLFNETVSLTLSSGNCTSSLSDTYCNFAIQLAPGSYIVDLTAVDANYTPLSAASSIAFTVASGQNTAVPVTLSGIPAKLQVAPGALAVHGPSASGFTLYGSAPQNLVVAALDADGNIIIGPGAPTFTASVVSGSGWSAGTPSSTSPNLLSITPPGNNGAGATIAVTANYPDSTCTLTGAVCSTSFAMKNDVQTLFVANQGSSTVTTYAPSYNDYPTSTISLGSTPYALGLDGNQNLFVAGLENNGVTGSIDEYAPPYVGSISNQFVFTGWPTSIAIDAAGDVFVPNYNSTGSVYEFAQPYSNTPTGSISGLAGSYVLALDRGNLFVANTGNGGIPGSVIEYAPPYNSPVATITITGASAEALAFDAAGDLFVVSNSSESPNLMEYTPPYSGSPIVARSVSGPRGLAVDAAGDLFVVGTSAVYEYAPPYTGSPVAVIAASGPLAAAIDGAGNLFVANYSASAVAEYAPPYTGAPTQITNGVSAPVTLLLTP